MNNPNLIVAPVVCDKQTDLGPFFESCLNDAVKNKCAVYSSLTFETNFNDPWPSLSRFIVRGHTIYFLKNNLRFSVACGQPVAETNFDGSHRFEKAKVWSQNLLLKTKIMNTRIETLDLFLPTLHSESSSSHSQIPALRIFLPQQSCPKRALISLLSIAS